jgi:hypothetical protein
VPGREGPKGLDGKDGAPGKDGLNGRDATLDNVRAVTDRERGTMAFVWKDGTPIEGAVWKMPTYRGVYVGGKAYEAGEFVTYAGSLWMAHEDTTQKPGEGFTAWQLCCKAGRDGKPGRDGKDGKNGRDGKDR